MFSGDCCAVSGSINHFYVLALGGGYLRPLLKTSLGDYHSPTRSQSFGEMKREMNDRGDDVCARSHPCTRKVLLLSDKTSKLIFRNEL